MPRLRYTLMRYPRASYGVHVLRESVGNARSVKNHASKRLRTHKSTRATRNCQHLRLCLLSGKHARTHTHMHTQRITHAANSKSVSFRKEAEKEKRKRNSYVRIRVESRGLREVSFSLDSLISLVSPYEQRRAVSLVLSPFRPPSFFSPSLSRSLGARNGLSCTNYYAEKKRIHAGWPA